MTSERPVVLSFPTPIKQTNIRTWEVIPLSKVHMKIWRPSWGAQRLQHLQGHRCPQSSQGTPPPNADTPSTTPRLLLTSAMRSTRWPSLPPPHSCHLPQMPGGQPGGGGKSLQSITSCPGWGILTPTIIVTEPQGAEAQGQMCASGTLLSL